MPLELASVPDWIGSLAEAGTFGIATTQFLRTREAQMAEAIRREVGLQIGELLARLGDDDRLAEMFLRAVQQAGTSFNEEKLEALRHCVTRAIHAADDAEVDAEHFVLSVVADLEVVHLRVLSLLLER